VIAARELDRGYLRALAEDTLAGDVDEVQLGLGELAGRVGSVVREDRDREHESLSARAWRAGLAAGLPLEWWAARSTGLLTVDGLGAFACYQHAGVPLLPTISASVALPSCCGDVLDRARRIRADDPIARSLTIATVTIAECDCTATIRRRQG